MSESLENLMYDLWNLLLIHQRLSNNAEELISYQERLKYHSHRKFPIFVMPFFVEIVDSLSAKVCALMYRRSLVSACINTANVWYNVEGMQSVPRIQRADTIIHKWQ